MNHLAEQEIAASLKTEACIGIATAPGISEK
jgi:hypothetical protein